MGNTIQNSIEMTDIAEIVKPRSELVIVEMADIADMVEPMPEVVSAKAGWNINKIQAAACMLASASVSVGLIAWAIHSFF
jgi:hypothetical protein